jgi:hypothetical protein
MNEINRNPLTELPADIAAIGIEFSRAIHAQHRRRTFRRARARRAAVVLAAIGVGSGTALAAELVGRDGRVTDPCIARAITAPPGTYRSLEQLNKACGLPYTPPVGTPHPPALPGTSTISGTASSDRR